MKTLLVYYSFGGNTERIVEMMKKEIGCDTLKIDTATPYTGTYNQVVDQGLSEVNSGYEPTLKEYDCDFRQYDNIILGTPVWWYSFAPAMKTFLSQADLGGKTVSFFATNGGWIGHTFEDFKKACPDSTCKGELNIRFDEHTLKTSEKEIINWVKSVG